MSLLELVIGFVVFTIGCTIQGVLGFGAGLFSVPILALVAPEFVPGPILMLNPVLCALFAWREHGAIDRKVLRWALIGRVPGVLLGVWALTAVSEDRLGLLFGVLLLAGVGLKVSGLRASRTPWTLMGAGSLSGFMGTSVAVGGPPIALVLDGSSGPEFRATLNAFFFVGTTISLAVLAMAGEFGTTDLLLAFYLLPSMLAGVTFSSRVRHLLDHVWLAPVVYTLSSSAAVVLVIRSLT
ncbi:MAG: sulfite exporter TauE/SafE family protein [Actinomycetota bacterium]|nr:sulfite exporter TauE/SafE family protein [Actinomycetota bacterium]MEC9426615.1 sulfite exporter TauE/SafE family protein [Actinomycetota bacterium]MEE3353980.1 sulfite exporter TauE/SafE family protein [Actinomycetota bacterium]